MQHIEVNEFQTPIADLHLENEPAEIQEQFFDFVSNVPYIKNLISSTRKRAKDLPRDKEDKIIVDLTQPHILEDMDYFIPSRLNYLKTGKYTELRPNPNPNSDYGKWIREEVRRCYYGYVRPSDGEWVTGDMYFFMNYCPMQVIEDADDDKKSDDEEATIMGERRMSFPRFWEGHYLLFHYLNQARKNGKHCMMLASRGRGKAHPYNTPVFTTEGWKLWKDIKVDDVLFGTNGETTKVTDIPFDGETEAYRITLADGRTIDAARDHLWKVYSHRNKDIVTVDTKTIFEKNIINRKISERNPSGKEYNYAIPSITGIELPYKETKVDPYTFGLLLGDGCFRHHEYSSVVSLTMLKDDLDEIRNFIPYEINTHKKNIEHTIVIPNIRDILKEYNLFNVKSEDKFIPEEYIYNSKEVRLNLLKGLIDSDGTVSTTGKIQIDLSSSTLIDGIVTICQTLGFNYRVHSRIPSYKDKKTGGKINGKRSYRLTIFTNEIIANLPRKAERMKNRPLSNYSQSKIKYTKIIDVKSIGYTKCKCVTVDSFDNCYLIGDFIPTHNSFVGAGMLAKRIILGENERVNKKTVCYITASDKSYLLGGDQTLDKFIYNIDFCALNTQFPASRITNSTNNMKWVFGYKDLDTNTFRGSQNAVVGVSSAKDEAKLRGTRGVLYVLEEMGTFPTLLNLYGNMRHSVEQGKKVFGTIFAYGTAGDNESDFSAAQEMMYNPNGYNLYALPNVYDKEGQARKHFVYFFPGYINYEGCYNKDGVSDVTKAILLLLKDRYVVKYNSTNPNAITKRIAESPIVPQEAILRTAGNLFPVTQINERIAQLDNDPNAFDDVYTGDFVLDKGNTVKFVPTNDTPILDFPLKNNTDRGAVQIFQMPSKDSNGKVFANRYIGGFDPYDNDQAESHSLGSFFILDLFTDQIVCEYTGRTTYAEELYEKFRLALLFYNARGLYESNKKGTFAYFSKMNSTHLLADTPEYLRDKQLVKYSNFGSNAKGVNASQAINNYADFLTKEWLIKPVPHEENIDGEIVISNIANLYHLKCRAFLKECVLYNPQINVDRIRAIGMLMLYREEFMILYEGDVKGKAESVDDRNYLGNDTFFNVNFSSNFTNSYM